LSSYVAHGKKTGADKTQDEGQHHQDSNATQQPKTRARAQRHGPSAATWPERSDMARAQRAPQQQARGALQPATLKLRRGALPGHRLEVARGSALLAEIPVSENRKLFLLDKNAFSVVSTGNRYESGSNM
jgi:hypothetical protein